MPKWTEKFNVYSMGCGVLSLICAWERGGYTVRVNDARLAQSFREIGEAQRAALALARRLLNETVTALEEAEAA